MLSNFIQSAVFAGLSCCVALSGAWAQTGGSRGDDVLLEMSQASKRNDKSRLTQLLPQARGHALEPWAAYWELKARLSSRPTLAVMRREWHAFWNYRVGRDSTRTPRYLWRVARTSS